MEKLIEKMKKIKDKIEGEEIYRPIEVIEGKIAVEFASPFGWNGDVVVEYNWSWAVAPSDSGKWKEWYKNMLMEEKECFK